MSREFIHRTSITVTFHVISTMNVNNVDYFDNCNNYRAEYIITVLSSRYSEHTNSYVATHVDWTIAVATVIIICILTYVNVSLNRRRRLQTRNNVKYIT